MSIRIVGEVLDWAPTQDHSEMLVLIVLAERADDDGVCWPGIKKIAEKSRMSERNVRYVLKRLLKNGLVQWDECRGRKKTNVYRINLQALHPPSETKPATERSKNLQPSATKPATAIAPDTSGTVIEPSPASQEAPEAPAVHEFLRVWCECYHAQFRERYVMANRPRDCAAVKRLLKSSGMSIAELMAVATAAWSKPRDEKKAWNCNRASEIWFFVNHFGGITRELGIAKGSIVADKTKGGWNADTLHRLIGSKGNAHG